MFLFKFEFYFVFIFIIVNLSLIYGKKIKNLTEEEKLMAEEFAKNVTIKLKILFKIIDKNENEKIEKNELINQIIRKIKNIQNNSIIELFEKVDTDKDQKVSLNEYFIFTHKKPKAALDILINADNSEETMILKKKVQLQKKCFNAADINKNGFLNIEEYLTFINPIFFNHTAEVLVTDFINNLDSNKDGTIDKVEHLYVYKNVDTMTKEDKEDTLKKIDEYFLKYDKDKNGKIDTDEYYGVMKPGYENQAIREAENLLLQTDTDNDEALSFKEFEKNSYSWIEAYWVDDDNDKVQGSSQHIGGEL